jgi:hypothetical protein
VASQLIALLGLCLSLVACDATDPIATASMDGLPERGALTKKNPVAFVEIDGPTFYVLFDPDVVSAAGVLWHSHKNCPGTPRNYSFPLSKPVQVRDDLQRMTMACQYKYN